MKRCEYCGRRMIARHAIERYHDRCAMTVTKWIKRRERDKSAPVVILKRPSETLKKLIDMVPEAARLYDYKREKGE